jgi:uncharacterized protein
MATNDAAKPQKLDQWFLDLLACPGCPERHGLTLTPDGNGLICACGKYRYPVNDGIPIILVDAAEVLDDARTPGDLGAQA